MTDLNSLMAEVDRQTDDLVQLLRDIIRVESVNTGRPPTGNETEAAKVLQKWLAERGIESRLVEGTSNRGNLIAGLSGQRAGPRLMYLAHTDVVPVEDPRQWTYPPFSGEVADGRVWGRGSLDCKGLVACEALAMAILKSSGLDFAGELRSVFTADEEGGCIWGAKWLAENLPDEVRADYAINEGPGFPIRTDSGRGYLFTVGSKGSVVVDITAHGESFHATQPWRADNALVKMAEVVRRIDAWESQRDVSLPIFSYLDRLAGIPEEVTPQNIDAIAARVGQQNLQLSHRLLGLSRMTMVPTLFSSGTASGVIPGESKLCVRATILPGQSVDTVSAILGELLADIPGVTFECTPRAEPSWSPHDTEFAERVRQAMQTAYGRDDVYLVPMLMNGAADTRYIRPLGTLAYDFWPFHPDADIEQYRTHCVDESVEIKTLTTSTKMLIALAYDVLKFGRAHD
jgi:acetylornithine deacetylase/succinyl-diaminopimelate desuccinylase-like protein